MPRKKLRWFAGCMISIWLVVGMLAVCMRNFASRFDLSTRNPSERFRMVFRIEPPKGIRDRRVAGYVNPGGGIAWMRFRTQNFDDVKAILKQSPKGLAPLADKD